MSQPPQYPQQPPPYRPNYQPPRPPKGGLNFKNVPVWAWIAIGVFVVVVIGALGSAASKSNATPTATVQAAVNPTAAVQAVATVAVQATTAAATTAAPTKAPTTTPAPTVTPKPTATLAPTATPKPTATPLPPTATPNVAATQAAQVAATQAVQAAATTNAQATIAALPKPIGFQGNGDKVSPKFTLHEGLAKCQVANKGSSNIIAELVDDQGNQVGLCANGIGNYSGDKYMVIKETGTYVLNITSDGNWSFNIVDEPILEAQQPIPMQAVYSGKGDAALKIHIDKSGLVIYKAKQIGGDSNFIIQAYDSDGSQLALIANGIGSYSSEKAIKTSPGDYYFEIMADSNWTLEITQ